jgi:gas vesicle protein
MGDDNNQSFDKYDEKGAGITKQRPARQAGSGIGGGLVGAAIGGLLGRRVGGVFGAVVGAAAGALVGKGTAERVNRTVESLVDAANSVSEGVNHSVNGVKDVGVALKDTIEQIQPSVIGVVDAVKDTIEQVQPSVVGAANTIAEGVNHSVNSVKDVGDALKNTIEQVQPSVVDAAKSVAEAINDTVNGVENELKDTVDQVRPSAINVEDAAKGTTDESKPVDTHNSKVYEEPLLTVQALRANQEHPEKIQKINGNLVGAVTITFMGLTLAFSPKQNLLATKSPEYNQSLSPTLETIADGWIFIGNINNASASALVERSLIKGSESTNLRVVPSVGSIVTVTVRPGLSLRKNRPQEPKFNHKEQKALAILKPREKLKILKVEFFTPSQTTAPATKVWAKVHRCGSACN